VNWQHQGPAPLAFVPGGSCQLARVGEADPRTLTVADIVLHPPATSSADAAQVARTSFTECAAAIVAIPVGRCELSAWSRDEQCVVLPRDDADPDDDVLRAAIAYVSWSSGQPLAVMAQNRAIRLTERRAMVEFLGSPAPIRHLSQTDPGQPNVPG
jgi:hypothetical protein